MHRIFSEIAYGMWGMEPRAMQGYLPLVVNFIKGVPANVSADAALRIFKETSSVKYADSTGHIYNVSQLDDSVEADEQPVEVPAGSVAILSLTNPITYNDVECGPAGMETMANVMKNIFDDGNIAAIVLEMNTPGGEGMAMFHMIRQMNEANKPIVAFVRHMAASAGAGIASAANYIIAESDLSKFGSFGTFVTLVDYAEFYNQQGVKVEDVYASRSTEKNEDYREAIKGNLKPLIESIDVFNETFLETVATNRTGKLTDDGHWHKGKLYYAPEALAIGMIDEIGSFERAIEKALELANQ